MQVRYSVIVNSFVLPTFLPRKSGAVHSDLMRPHDWYTLKEKSKDSTSFFCPQFHVLWWYLQSPVQRFPNLFLEKLIFFFLISSCLNSELSDFLFPVSELVGIFLMSSIEWHCI